MRWTTGERGSKEDESAIVNIPSHRREVFPERSRSMHSFARHRHDKSGEASAKETNRLIGSGGWRYDLGIWFIDTFVFRGQLRELRRRTARAGLRAFMPGGAAYQIWLLWSRTPVSQR